MAKPCPCGCGRSIGWRARRAANRALFVRSLMPVVQRGRELFIEKQSVPGDVLRCDVLINRGRQYEAGYLALAHGEPLFEGNGDFYLVGNKKVARPQNRDLNDWESVVLGVRREVAARDPEWDKEYQQSGGPHRKV